MPIPATHLNEAEPSLHARIEKLLAAEEKVRNFFLRNEPGAVYHAECSEIRDRFADDPPHDALGPFSTFEKALARLNDIYDKKDSKKNCYCYRIRKTILDSNKRAEFIVSLDGALLHSITNINILDKDENESTIFFENFYIYIPTPFKRGDIVEYRNIYGGSTLYVLDTLAYEDAVQHERHLRNGDGSDMCFSFFTGGNSSIYHEVWQNSFDLIYYRGKLPKGYERLACVSAFIKGKLAIDELINLSRLLEHRQFALDDCEMQNTLRHIGYVKEQPDAFKDQGWLAELLGDE